MRTSSLPRRWPRAVVLLLVATTLAAAPSTAADTPPTLEQVRRAAESRDYEALRAYGPSVLPALARLYPTASTELKIGIARAWYALGWRSEEAKEALFADLGTLDPELRLEVQWALGRVSADPEVVRRLLVTMREDPNPLFRDKAACALAYDQIHLEPEERLAQFGGLIAALEDQEPQVRQIAIQALSILTGQGKGYHPNAPPEARRAAVERWQRWLDDYRSSL